MAGIRLGSGRRRRRSSFLAQNLACARPITKGTNRCRARAHFVPFADFCNLNAQPQQIPPKPAAAPSESEPIAVSGVLPGVLGVLADGAIGFAPKANRAHSARPDFRTQNFLSRGPLSCDFLHEMAVA